MKKKKIVAPAAEVPKETENVVAKSETEATTEPATRSPDPPVQQSRSIRDIVQSIPKEQAVMIENFPILKELLVYLHQQEQKVDAIINALQAAQQPQGNPGAPPVPAQGGNMLSSIAQFAPLVMKALGGGGGSNEKANQVMDALLNRALEDITNPKPDLLTEYVRQLMAKKVAQNVVSATDAL